MALPLHDVCCADLPLAALAALADLRGAAGVSVALVDGRAWVLWPPGDEQVLRRVLPAPDVVLYVQRDGLWYRHGSHLPAFDFPERLDDRPLHEVLVPAPVEPVAQPNVTLSRVRVTLVPDQRPRQTTALLCSLAELSRWADTMPAARLAALRAAYCDDRALLLGKRLPVLRGGERFWGESVLAPLGQRHEPALPEQALRQALRVSDDDLLLLRPGKAEVIARKLLQPLTRARVRLASGEARP